MLAVASRRDLELLRCAVQRRDRGGTRTHRKRLGMTNIVVPGVRIGATLAVLVVTMSNCGEATPPGVAAVGDAVGDATCPRPTGTMVVHVVASELSSDPTESCSYSDCTRPGGEFPVNWYSADLMSIVDPFSGSGQSALAADAKCEESVDARCARKIHCTYIGWIGSLDYTITVNKTDEGWTGHGVYLAHSQVGFPHTCIATLTYSYQYKPPPPKWCWQ